MVDVSKRLSGSPKVQPRSKLPKKWMSEPNLLNDDDEDEHWIKEKDNMEEEGVSFTDDVSEPSRLMHMNKQRVQLRPKRRPPSRDFVRSRASMDFDLNVPEKIEEGDEEIKQDEATEVEPKVQLPVRPTPPPKPGIDNGWRLPTPGPNVVLRKTKPVETQSRITEETKSNEINEPEVEASNFNDNIHDFTPESSPEKRHKERKRFKLPLFKFRRSRKGKQNGKTPTKEVDRKTNLTETRALSMDSGARPLGEDSRRRLPNRRSRKSEERGLNWLLGLFHKKDNPDSTEDTSMNREDVQKNSENVPNTHDTNSNGKPEIHRTVPEVRVGGDLSNGHTSHENEAEHNPETVKDLRQKFEERISAAF